MPHVSWKTHLFKCTSGSSTPALSGGRHICLYVTVWMQIAVEYLHLHVLSQRIPQWHRHNTFHIKTFQFSSPFFPFHHSPVGSNPPLIPKVLYSRLPPAKFSPHAKSIPGWKWCQVNLKESVNITGMLYILGTVRVWRSVRYERGGPVC